MKNITRTFVLMVWLGMGVASVMAMGTEERERGCEMAWWVKPMIFVGAPFFVTGKIVADSLGWKPEERVEGCIE